MSQLRAEYGVNSSLEVAQVEAYHIMIMTMMMMIMRMIIVMMIAEAT